MEKVCVTGASGYLGSSLVRKLLERGYIVHGTLRNLEESSKVGLLKSLPHADTRLVLFQADLYNPHEFEQAIQGCTFVFHVATPFIHTDGFQFKNTNEAAVSSVKSIAMSCKKSGSVRKLIYTASVVSASPMKEDGNGFKDTMDETCWTPLNLSFAYYDDFLKGYTESKTLAEKELLEFGAKGCGIEVITLACGLVGGDTLLPYTPSSVNAVISQLPISTEYAYKGLRFLEEMLGKVPIVHIDDVSEAHIFCAENPDVGTGRFLCASSYVSTAEIVNFYQSFYPEFQVKQEILNGAERDIKWGSNKLTEIGFEYKYDLKTIIDDSIRCASRTGDLQL